MSGKITFTDSDSLAEFLKAFTGSTAVFEVVQEGNAYIMTFTGGY